MTTGAEKPSLPSLAVVQCELHEANAFVAAYHRHHKPLHRVRFSVGAVVKGTRRNNERSTGSRGRWHERGQDEREVRLWSPPVQRGLVLRPMPVLRGTPCEVPRCRLNGAHTLRLRSSQFPGATPSRADAIHAAGTRSLSASMTRNARKRGSAATDARRRPRNEPLLLALHRFRRGKAPLVLPAEVGLMVEPSRWEWDMGCDVCGLCVCIQAAADSAPIAVCEVDQRVLKVRCVRKDEDLAHLQARLDGAK